MKMGVKLYWFICGAIFSLLFEQNESYSSKCFLNKSTTEIPQDHVFYRIEKPAIIGYKGNIKSYQENTLEGLKDVIDKKYQGIHMQVQMTRDDKIIVFGDNNFLRLTGVDASVRIADYQAVKGLRLKTSVAAGVNNTFKYSETAKIPLLEDVLDEVTGKGVLIYIELMPADAPPVSSVEREHALRLGLAIAKLIRKLKLENEVFVVSSDPFKLQVVNHENPNIVTGWWFQEEFYESKTAAKMREEFVDLNGLRDCYKTVAPAGTYFAAFLYETGIVTKSVNGSIFDASFDIVNNPIYFDGRSDTTQSILRKNYNSKISHGSILTYYENGVARDRKADNSKLHKDVTKGLDRIITDDVADVNMMLNSIGSKGSHVTVNTFMMLSGLFVTSVYNVLSLI